MQNGIKLVYGSISARVSDGSVELLLVEENRSSLRDILLLRLCCFMCVTPLGSGN